VVAHPSSALGLDVGALGDELVDESKVTEMGGHMEGGQTVLWCGRESGVWGSRHRGGGAMAGGVRAGLKGERGRGRDSGSCEKVPMQGRVCGARSVKPGAAPRPAEASGGKDVRYRVVAPKNA
jgi:hypothetical protein